MFKWPYTIVHLYWYVKDPSKPQVAFIPPASVWWAPIRCQALLRFLGHISEQEERSPPSGASMPGWWFMCINCDIHLSCDGITAVLIYIFLFWLKTRKLFILCLQAEPFHNTRNLERLFNDNQVSFMVCMCCNSFPWGYGGHMVAFKTVKPVWLNRATCSGVSGLEVIILRLHYCSF